MKKLSILGVAVVVASSAFAATQLVSGGTSQVAAPVTIVSAPSKPSAAPAPQTVASDAIDLSTKPVPGADTRWLAPGQGQLAGFVSNFNVKALLVPSWGTGQIASSSRPDTVGAFRFICLAGHLLRDDPIVYPGQPGKSHLHQFFGNTTANAFSTYGSLRVKGDSTCSNMLNRSAYWIPAMLNGKGKVVRPDFVSIYYKRLPASDPNCQVVARACVSLPRGMRYVFGYNMATGVAANFHFDCNGPTGVPGNYPDIVSAAKNCPAGNRLGAIINGPDCWDGRNLNSTDHRKHVAYGEYGWIGRYHCPATHPYAIPAFTLGAWYEVDEDLDRSGEWAPGKSTWSLSSDSMPGMAPMRPGSTLHGDWLGAWDDGVMQMWMENCINKQLSCNGGDLGNGLQLKEHPGFSWNAKPRLVDIP